MPVAGDTGYLHIALTSDDADIVRRIAREEDRSLTSVIRRALRSYAETSGYVNTDARPVKAS